MTQRKEQFHCLKLTHSCRVEATFAMLTRVIGFVLPSAKLILYMTLLGGVTLVYLNADGEDQSKPRAGLDYFSTLVAECHPCASK